MNIHLNRCLTILAGLIGFLSVTVLLINYFSFKFTGNNYFPENVILPALILILFYFGLVLTFGKESKISRSGLHLIYWFGVISLIALATNAVQLTPFKPIDDKIVYLESYLKINIASILLWTSYHTHVHYVLSNIYDSLAYQMCVLPLLAIIMGRFNLLKDYYFLMLFTVLIGFGFYYFFPTTAPASIINSPLFLQSQNDTALKFNQIHHYIIPTTNDGGLIALPSFHTVWALLCIYLVKDWPLIYVPLMFINTLLILSCVMLGWHYPTDVVGAILLVLIAYCFLSWTKAVK
ncbi:MAG: phosphatase PAP2 family protein [bacterium]|nr:phosphatase PAP2 family protein [bacterium]